jgi:hypothetical protein
MLQLENRSPFAVAVAAFPDEQGIDTLVVAVKVTYKTYPRFVLADVQRPVELGDRYSGDPTRTGLIAASELTLQKQGTDVVMIGDARTHREYPAPYAAVSLSVAERKMTIGVFGDRYWESLGRISSPRPFVRMPLVWERAFGGTVPERGRDGLRASSLNPVGAGLRNRVGDPLPNLEDPRAPITGLGDTPDPVCFAPVAPGWLPRREHAGTYDAEWVRKRSPYLPSDFSRRFFNAGPGPFAFDRFLVGGEPVEAIGVSPHGGMRFTLPRCQLLLHVRVAGGWEMLMPFLNTVTLHPDSDEVALTYVGTLGCDRKLLAVEKVSIDQRAEAAA